jgi:hypothetical protein
MTALPDGQSIDSRANGINVDGSVIVGHIDGVATVWLSGVPYPLAYLLASSGIDVSQLEFHELTDCSRSGRIVVGYGFDAAVGNVAFRAELPLYNRPPSASAGRNQSVRTADKKGAWVDLDGSRSSDPDEDGLRYRWSAPKVRFEDREVQKTRAFFPLGTTKVTLSVKDESDLTDSDTIRVTVRRAGGKDEADFVIE